MQFCCSINVRREIKIGYQKLFRLITKNVTSININEEKLFVYWKIKKENEILNRINKIKNKNCKRNVYEILIKSIRLGIRWKNEWNNKISDRWKNGCRDKEIYEIYQGLAQITFASF